MTDLLLKIKQEGWVSGWDDTVGKCPYPDGSEEKTAWLSGYDQALIEYSNSFDL